MHRFFRSRPHLLWLLLLAGLGPAVAQTPIAKSASAPASAGTAPYPVVLPAQGGSASPPSAALTPAQIQAQNSVLAAQNAALLSQNGLLSSQSVSLGASVAALTAGNAALNASIAALNAQVVSLSGAANAPPVAFGQAYTDTTGRIVVAHYVVSQSVGGVGHSAADVVAGYEAEMREDVAMGIDGWVLDYGATGGQYPGDIDSIYQAAHALTPTLSSIPNPAGIKQFVLTECPDMSGGIPETPASLAAVGTLFAKYASDPATLTIQGRPVLSMYAGDGGGASVVGPVYNPMLAEIRAGSLGYPAANVFFLPMWADVGELAAVDAGGGSAFPPGTAPLGAQSPIASVEALGAAVQAAKTAAGAPLVFMQPLFPGRYSNADGTQGHFYNEYGGDRSDDAEWASVLNTVHPAITELLTQNDIAESAVTSLTATSTWQGLYNVGVPDYWQLQPGLQRGIAYNVQSYKTGQRPIITQDTLCIFNRTQTAAASYAATADPHPGISYVTGILGEPTGLLDEINTRIELTRTATIELSGVGPTQAVVEPAGISHPVFFFTQAGTPVLTERVQGQVVRQVTGHPIAGTATLVNLNVASRTSVPGVSFTVSAPIPTPALPVDRAGIIVRSTNTSYRALGACNFSATDLTPATPVVFAQSTLQDPAALNGTLLQSKLANSTVAGQDVLGQYNGYAYIGLYQNPLNVAQSLAYVQYPANIDAANRVNKPLPSAHVKVSVRAIYTKADNDGIVGPALVCSTGDTYDGRGYYAQLEVYAGAWSLNIKAVTNFNSDVNSAGPVTLASIGVNSLALGEWYDVSLTTDGTTLSATATPSNQQLP